MTLLLRYAVLLCLLSLSTGYALAAPVLLHPDKTELQMHAQVYLDRSRALDYAAVSSVQMDTLFQPMTEVEESYRFGEMWMKFTVQQIYDVDKEWWLEILPASLEDITFYQVAPDGTLVQRQAGQNFPVSSRDVAYRHVVFKVAMQGNQPHVFYLKVTSKYESVRRILLWDPAVFVEKSTESTLIWGSYLGIFLLLTIASIWFEKAVGDGVYRAFGMYTVSCILMTLAGIGMLHQYFTPAFLINKDIPYAYWTVMFGLVAFVEFLFRFVGMHTIKPRLTRYYLGTIRVYAMVMSLALLVDEYDSAIREFIEFTTDFVIIPIAIILLWKPVRKNVSAVRNAFVFSGLLLVVAVLIQYFIDNGTLSADGYIEYAPAIFSLVFSLVIYYSISRRYQAMRHEREAARKAILQMVLDSERQLEQQVEEKTRDLMQAKAVVESALSQERAAYDEQKNFIAMISHELRTPLAVIDATVQNMTREAPDATVKMRMRFNKIQQSTDRLSALISDYLSNNRFEVLSRGIHCAYIDLLPLLKDAADAVAPLAENNVFVLDSRIPGSVIWADPDLLRLVLRTLVDNAVKYTPAGTSVTLHAASIDKGWHIDIIDDGEGIVAGERELVFERYYRGRSAVKRTGTGLGLPLARHLIELQGGTLQLLYTTQHGCTFRIFLPKPDQPSA